MSESKHTPGPWTYEYDNSDTGGGQWYDIKGPNGESLLWWPYNAIDAVADRCLANAHLIAAAPETTRQRDALREAAELAEATIERLSGERRPGQFSSIKGTLDVLRAAIADAKGG